MLTDRISVFLAAFCGGCLLLLAWATCFVAADFSAKDAGESIRASLRFSMEQSNPCHQEPEPALDGKGEDSDKPEKADKQNAGGVIAERATPGTRSSLPRIAPCDPPYLQINLPSWCGLVPYPLPPPSSHPA